MISKVSKYTYLLNRGKLGFLLVMSLAVSLLHLGCWGRLRPIDSQGRQPGSQKLKEAAAGWTSWVSTGNPWGGCRNLTWDWRRGCGEATLLCHFSAEWLGETCTSRPASGFQKFLFCFKPVWRLREPCLVVLSADEGTRGPSAAGDEGCVMRSHVRTHICPLALPLQAAGLRG